MRAPSDAARATGTLSATRNGAGDPKRQAGTQAHNMRTRNLGEPRDHDPNDLD
jgi:hypothetical protein